MIDKELEQIRARLEARPEASGADAQLTALEEAVKARFSREALQRFGTLKLAHPNTASRLIGIIAQLIEAGRITGTVSDEQLKSLLKQMAELSKRR